MSYFLWPHGLQHVRLPCPPLSPGVCSDSCPLSQWCYLTTSSSAARFCFCLQSFPAPGSFPMSQLFTSGGQRIGDSASVLPVNIQCWFPLGLIGLISLQSKGLSRVFSSTTIWRHQFYKILQNGSHLHPYFLALISHYCPLNSLYSEPACCSWHTLSSFRSQGICLCCLCPWKALHPYLGWDCCLTLSRFWLNRPWLISKKE